MVSYESMPLRDPEARKAYHREYLKRRYHNDEAYRLTHQTRARRSDVERQERVLVVIEAFRAAGCLLCGEREACCLTAHHTLPETKEFNIGDAVSKKMGPERVSAELAKCVCLCANCHAKVHAGKLTIPRG